MNTEQLKSLAASGRVLSTDLVWKAGMAEWALAGNLKGLHFDSPVKEPSSLAITAYSTVRPRLTNICSALHFTTKRLILTVMILAGSIGLTLALHVSRTFSADKASLSDLPDFSKVDYSFPFNEKDYVFDFSSVNYKQGPQGQKLTRRVFVIDGDGKRYALEKATSFEKSQARTYETQLGFLDSSGKFIQHGPTRIHGRFERAILKDEANAPPKPQAAQPHRKTHEEIVRDGEAKKEEAETLHPERLEVLEVSFYFNGVLHGPTKKWGPTKSMPLDDRLHETDRFKKTLNDRVAGPLLLQGFYMHGDKFGKWTTWELGEATVENHFEAPVFKRLENYWKKGKENGPETVFSPDGQIEFAKLYKEGKLHGKQTWITDGNDFDEGRSDDLFQDAIDRKLGGKGESYFLDGKFHGPFRLFYPSGAKFVEMAFFNDLPVGSMMVFHKNGSRRLSFNFVNGKVSGTFQEDYANGANRTTGGYQDSLRDGKWVMLDTDGAKIFEGTYIKGKADGVHRQWYAQTKSANLSELDTYVCGVRNGLHELFYQPTSTNGNSVVSQREIWSNGKLIKFSQYDVDGTMTKSDDYSARNGN